MKIFEALRQDHEKQRLLLKILAETSGDTAARREYYQELKNQLESHAIAEHHEIDELLAKLDDTDMSSPAWLRHLKNLQEKVEHHLADEEQEFFQVAGNVLNDRQKTKLAEEYQKEMRQELDDEKLTA